MSAAAAEAAPARIVLAGRPNAGKSTLFNRLVGGRRAIVDPTPGVTRDENRAVIERGGRRYEIVDTGGVEEGRPDASLAGRVHERTEAALGRADAIVYLLDGKAGLSPADAAVAQRLRELGRPLIFTVNKIDAPWHQGRLAEFAALGAGDLVAISAAHGTGIADLWERIEEALGREPLGAPERREAAAEPGRGDAPARRSRRRRQPAAAAEPIGGPARAEPEAGSASERAGPPRFALVGRPNVGKSSLLNRLVGFERCLVDDAPGTTRDAIDVEIERSGRRFVIVDTAGLRRRSRIVEALEARAVGAALGALDRADVVVLVVEADRGLLDQDLRLADLVWRHGRGLVVAVNKADLAPSLALEQCGEAVARALPQWPPVPVVLLSARQGRGLDDLLGAVDQVAAACRRRVPTARLNEAVERAAAEHPPPLRSGRPVKLMYATQVAVAPPTIVVFLSQPGGVAESFRRYLAHRLREEFGWVGAPLRISFRARRARPREAREGSRQRARPAKRGRRG